MSKIGPPPSNPIADRMRESEEQELQRNREFTLRLREENEIHLAETARLLTKHQRQITEDLKRRHAEHAEILQQSFNAALERYDAAYQRRVALLPKNGLIMLIVGTLIGLAVYGGVEVLTQSRANDLEAELADLRAEQQVQTAILETLKTEAWGVVLEQTQEGQRRVQLPVGSEILERRIGGRIIAVVPPAPVE